MILKMIHYLKKLFSNSNSTATQMNKEKIIHQEINKISKILQEAQEKNECEDVIADYITNSFQKLKAHCSAAELDKRYIWPLYVKLSVSCVSYPLETLIEYVNSDNYIYLTKSMSDLEKSINKNHVQAVSTNMELFATTVYTHILNHINPEDVPCCLALGKAEQKKGNYENARKWFSRIVETTNSFNGITALLSSYEEEINALLANNNTTYNNYQKRELIAKLNDYQADLYEKWCKKLESDINDPDKTTYKNQKEYVVLITGYARLERKRGNYHKSLSILDQIPDFLPEIYRVYVEKGLLFQIKPGKNKYYNLDKAIQCFRQAEASVKEREQTEQIELKGLKSILMPLANTYFLSGRYAEANQICDMVLAHDIKEKRAHELKRRLNCLAS